MNFKLLPTIQLSIRMPIGKCGVFIVVYQDYFSHFEFYLLKKKLNDAGFYYFGDPERCMSHLLLLFSKYPMIFAETDLIATIAC